MDIPGVVSAVCGGNTPDESGDGDGDRIAPTGSFLEDGTDEGSIPGPTEVPSSDDPPEGSYMSPGTGMSTSFCKDVICSLLFPRSLVPSLTCYS